MAMVDDNLFGCRYLFSFIQKDRQCESLIEKLCHRFRATRYREYNQECKMTSWRNNNGVIMHS